MFLQAGAVSLALLLASRVLGLLRETALAAAFGASGEADIAVLMFTLPDLVAGLFASGALAYVLLPHWGGAGASTLAATQRRIGRFLLAAGGVVGLMIVVVAMPLAGWLAGGLPAPLLAAAAEGLRWGAIAIPAALLAALWGTRAQHERDFVGLYGSNLLVNVVLVGAICAVALAGSGPNAVMVLGIALLAASVLRLAWLRSRMPRPSPDAVPFADGPVPLPPGAVWAWAALSAGLPLALPFAARSIASHEGEGLLAAFNYAWKLVELPLVLAIQLVSALAFPAIARAAGRGEDARDAARGAFALAWTLACAAAAGLLAGALPAARLLFGWGRMPPEAVERIAAWASVGAWGLLPQAVAAVALTVLATQGRLRVAALAYGGALTLLLAGAAAGLTGGRQLMWLMNVAMAFVCTVTLVAMGVGTWSRLPARAMGAALLALAAVAAASALLAPAIAALPLVAGIASAAVAAGLVMAAAFLASADVRAALRR